MRARFNLLKRSFIKEIVLLFSRFMLLIFVFPLWNVNLIVVTCHRERSFYLATCRRRRQRRQSRVNSSYFVSYGIQSITGNLFLAIFEYLPATRWFGEGGATVKWPRKSTGYLNRRTQHPENSVERQLRGRPNDGIGLEQKSRPRNWPRAAPNLWTPLIPWVVL